MTKQKPEIKKVLNPPPCLPAKARARLGKLCEKLRNFRTSPKELELVKGMRVADGLGKDMNPGMSPPVDPKIIEPPSESMAEYLAMKKDSVSE